MKYFSAILLVAFLMMLSAPLHAAEAVEAVEAVGAAAER